MRSIFDGLLRMGVAGIVIIVMICIALAPILVAAAPIIIGGCIVVYVLIMVGGAIKSVSELAAKRKENLRQDPRRRF